MPKLYFYYSAMNAGKSTTLLQSSFNYHERGMKTLLFMPTICDKSSRTKATSNNTTSSSPNDESNGAALKMGRISCRIGLDAPCILFDEEFDFYRVVMKMFGYCDLDEERFNWEEYGAYKSPKMIKSSTPTQKSTTTQAPLFASCILIDECQFLTPTQVSQLAHLVVSAHVPILCYGLRSDYRGLPFPGSAALLTLADELVEIKTVCFCGSKATMNMRISTYTNSGSNNVNMGDDGENKENLKKHSSNKLPIEEELEDRNSKKFIKLDGNVKLRVLRSGNPIDIGGNDKYVSVCRKHFYEGKAFKEEQ